MERCQDMEVYLSLRLDGMLEPEQEQELEEHLALCPQCRRLADELAAIHSALPQAEELEAPQGFAQSVMEQVAALEEKKPKVVPLFRRPQVRALMGLAACAVLCIGLYRGGLFHKQADGLDIAAYQQGESQPTQASSQENGKEEESLQERALTQGILTEESSADTVPEETTEYQVGVNAATAPFSAEPSEYKVAGQQVCAVLTVDALPVGWEEILGEAPDWLEDEAGHACLIVEGPQLETLMDLVQEQGLTSSLAGQVNQELPCALVVLNET